MLPKTVTEKAATEEEAAYRGKRLEGERWSMCRSMCWSMWSIRTRVSVGGGVGGVGGVGGGSEALGEATTAPLRTAVEVTLHGGFDLKSAQASIAHRPTHALPKEAAPIAQP